ncbi:conserved hypothetical protein [Frankia canadensis]|uniref:Uncharacterized protein n=1 Tax=Frankia canadensis TaxID=1836972 RepID=A0A2I2KUG4_9ACTN|nr:hypothetical protein [Frankia canadensis]SNQ49301.1 conserved hypothetical protein [Frankia canadensis]SOU56591.1 conserved hypothetical protein [Frankia canadensis]
MTEDGHFAPERLELADLVCLTGAETARYAGVAIPNERDVAIVDLLRKARRTGGPGQLLDLIRPEVEAETLRTFALRMASLAVRRADPELLRMGLLAVSVSTLRAVDRHDDVSVLAPLWRTASLLRLDPAAEFAAAAAEFPAAAPLLSGWLDRPASLRELTVLGFHESADADGFRYAEDWAELSREFDEEFAHRSLLRRVTLPLLRRRPRH